MEWSDVGSSLFSKGELDDFDQLTTLVSDVVKRRLESELTQQQLADKAGLKQSAVARFESLGAIPRVDTLLKLIRTLGLQIKLEPVRD